MTEFTPEQYLVNRLVSENNWEFDNYYAHHPSGVCLIMSNSEDGIIIKLSQDSHGANSVIIPKSEDRHRLYSKLAPGFEKHISKQHSLAAEAMLKKIDHD